MKSATVTITLTPAEWHDLRNRAGIYMMREGVGQELTLEQRVIVALSIAARDCDEMSRIETEAS